MRKVQFFISIIIMMIVWKLVLYTIKYVSMWACKCLNNQLQDEENMEDRIAKQSITAQGECNSGELIGPLCKNEVGWGIELPFSWKTSQLKMDFICKGGRGRGAVKMDWIGLLRRTLNYFATLSLKCVVTYATVW